MIAWDGTAPNLAVNGLTALLGRDEWRAHPDGERIRRLLRPFLDSADETLRMLATMSLPLLIEPETLTGNLCERLSREHSAQVCEVLIGVLAARAPNDPEGIDACLSRLAANADWPTLTAEPEDRSIPLKERHSEVGDVLIQVLLHLAIVRTTSFASALLASWEQAPEERPATIGRLVAFCRSYLNPPSEKGAKVQARAFDLLANLAESCAAINATARQKLSSGTRPDVDQRQDAEAATWIDHCIAQEIYHASGAFRHPNERSQPDERDVSAPFCSLSFPIIEILATVRNAAILHHLVQTLAFLSRREPRRAFMAVAKIAAPGSGYEYESIGEQEVLDLVELYLAERRHIILDDPQCLSGLRQILETFVSAGSDRAIRKVQDLAELFT